MGQSTIFKATLAIAALGLAGCMNTANTGQDSSRFAGGLLDAPSKEQQARTAAFIDALSARQSVFPDGSSFGQVSDAVLAANSRAAEAELRGARLRAEAANLNWLPSIGPDISLSSLGALVANLVVEQTLFDNGKKKAEREFAAADVEVAAVNLSQDTNDRVFTALELYLKAEKARERAAHIDQSLKYLAHFEYVMSERVNGGLSDASDLNVLRQKLSTMRSRRDADAETANAALAELNAMAAKPLQNLRGLSDVRVMPDGSMALDVMLARAERNRTIAAAKAERAGYLPGLTAGGTVGQGGSNMGLNLRMDQLLGFGTGASLKAIEAAKDAAERNVGQAQEDANRQIASLESQLGSLARQGGEAASLTQSAHQNLDLFRRQFEAGTKQAMDVVGVYETYMGQVERQLDLKYDLATTRLKIAREQGLLVDGDKV